MGTLGGEQGVEDVTTEPAARTEAPPQSRWDEWHRETAARVLAVALVVAGAILAWWWLPEMWDRREPCAGEGPECTAPPAFVSWAGFFAGLVAIPTGLVSAVVLVRYAVKVRWWRFGRAAIAQFAIAMVAWAFFFVLAEVLD